MLLMEEILHIIWRYMENLPLVLLVGFIHLNGYGISSINYIRSLSLWWKHIPHSKPDHPVLSSGKHQDFKTSATEFLTMTHSMSARRCHSVILSWVKRTSLADKRARAQTVLARCRGVTTCDEAFVEAQIRTWRERIKSFNTALPSRLWPSRLLAKRCNAVTKCASSNSARRASTKFRMALPLSKATISRLSLISKAGGPLDGVEARCYRRGLVSWLPE